jgi:hypothetical protein
MASSSDNKLVVNNSSKSEEFINDVFAEKLTSIEFNGSTKEKQTIEPCASSTNYFATENRPIYIENNYGVIHITAFSCSKGNMDSTEASDITNVKIINNNGTIMICDNCQLNIDIPNNTIEKFETNMQDGEMIPPVQSALDNDNRNGMLEISSCAGNLTSRRGRV